MFPEIGIEKNPKNVNNFSVNKNKFFSTHPNRVGSVSPSNHIVSHTTLSTRQIDLSSHFFDSTVFFDHQEVMLNQHMKFALFHLKIKSTVVELERLEQ